MPTLLAPTSVLVTTTYDSPLGPLLLGATEDGVCLVEFDAGDRPAGQLAALRRHAGPPEEGEHPYLEQLREELTEYFAGNRCRFEVPLCYPGTPFQRAVWEGLLRIPYGETRSYEDLAIAVGAPKGSRAVGRANGQNRIAIVIPCHRVINKGGALGGYGGELWRKQFLLDLEQRVGVGEPGA